MDNRESMGPSAPVLEMMEQGSTVMRVENENLQAMALQKPRRIKDLTAAAFDELRAFPKFAAKAYYSIPYKDRSTGEEKTVMVEGPSIKAANALVRHWGNNSSGFRIVGADEERVMIQGVFIDHETGMRRTAEISVSRKARKRDGTYYPLAADRLNMAIQAGGSKAVRNAILNALPIGLVDGYFEESKRIAARGGRVSSEANSPTDTAQIAAQMEECFQRLEALGVERSEVMDYSTRHPELKDEEAVCAHLIGVLNALDDGQTTIEEVFTAPTKPITEPQRTSAPAAAIAVTPAQPPPPERRTLPKDRRRMKSTIDGSTCPVCKKKISKGQWIWRNAETNRWEHEEC